MEVEKTTSQKLKGNYQVGKQQRPLTYHLTETLLHSLLVAKVYLLTWLATLKPKSVYLTEQIEIKQLKAKI